jgi:hypothetical protein
MARRPLQQADAKAGFQLFDGIGHGRARQACIFGGGGKTAALHDTGEHPHGIESVHLICSYFPDSDAESWMIIRVKKSVIFCTSKTRCGAND